MAYVLYSRINQNVGREMEMEAHKEPGKGSKPLPEEEDGSKQGRYINTPGHTNTA
jgi:hypothetical protein